MFEFIVNGFLNFLSLRNFTGESLSFSRESDHLFVYQFETVVYGKILADVVDDQVDAALENPRTGEEAGPALNGVIEDFGL